MHFLHRVHHVFMRFFDRIEFRLLLRIQERTNLRSGAFHDRAHLLHRFFMDGFDLRFGRVNDRTELMIFITPRVVSERVAAAIR